MTTRKNEHGCAITTYRQALASAMKKNLTAPFFLNRQGLNVGHRYIQ
jgi:hypothetical protein